MRKLLTKVNQETYKKYKSPDIVTVVEVRRFEWLGHVVRMDSVGYNWIN